MVIPRAEIKFKESDALDSFSVIAPNWIICLHFYFGSIEDIFLIFGETNELTRKTDTLRELRVKVI